MTSHLLSKSYNRPSPDGEYPHYDDRFSYSVQSPDFYHGYYPVNQEEDDVTRGMTPSKKSNALTLGDIAREYSDNLDSEMMNSPRSIYASQSRFDDVTFHKHSDNLFKGTKMSRKNKTSKSNGRINRAIPNNYVQSRAGRLRGEPASCAIEPYPTQPPHERRIRKYSDGDVNRLNLVSQSGFDPIIMSTRRKAESADVRCTQRIWVSQVPIQTLHDSCRYVSPPVTTTIVWRHTEAWRHA